jgi:hypothetical protein
MKKCTHHRQLTANSIFCPCCRRLSCHQPLHPPDPPRRNPTFHHSVAQLARLAACCCHRLRSRAVCARRRMVAHRAMLLSRPMPRSGFVLRWFALGSRDGRRQLGAALQNHDLGVRDAQAAWYGLAQRESVDPVSLSCLFAKAISRDCSYPTPPQYLHLWKKHTRSYHLRPRHFDTYAGVKLFRGSEIIGDIKSSCTASRGAEKKKFGSGIRGLSVV